MRSLCALDEDFTSKKIIPLLKLTNSSYILHIMTNSFYNHKFLMTYAEDYKMIIKFLKMKSCIIYICPRAAN